MMNDSTEPSIQEDFLARGGWLAVHVKKPEAAGMTTHEGVLHPDEYVDASKLQALVEPLLGFTYDEVRSVLVQGRKSAEQLALRDRIDARLLEVYEAGGNMVELGRALGLKIQTDMHCDSIKGALRRARRNGGTA